MGTNGETWLRSGTALPIPTTPSVNEVAGDLRLSVVHTLSARMAAPVALADFLAEAADLLASAVKSDACLIYVQRENELALRASKNPPADAADRLKLKAGDENAKWLGEPFRPVVLSQNAHADRRFQLFNKLSEERFEAFLSVPVLSQGRSLGVINVQNYARHFYGGEEVRLVSTVSSLVGAKLEIAHLENEARQLSKQLETRKAVERAKGILQSSLNISEGDAYQKLQRQSQQYRKSMKEIADAIILSHAVTGPTP